MIKTILALLEAKFPGVRKDVLQNLAGVMALQVEDEAGANDVVGKLTADKVSAFGQQYRSAIDREIQQSVQTNEQNLRNKYNFVEKQNQQQQQQQQQQQNQQQQQQQEQQQAGGITLDQIRALMAEQMQPFAQRLDAIDAQKVAQTRRETYVGKLKEAKLDEAMIGMMTSQFDMMQFADDNAFNAFMAGQQPNIDKLAQQAANNLLRQDTKPSFASVNNDGVSNAVEAYLKKEGGNGLGGKAI